MTPDFRGRRLLVRDDGRLLGTPLLLVAGAVSAADLAFAVDSIPAAFAVTRDPVVIWSANAFALLGLGSLLAVVEILISRFRYLNETIAVILAFVGFKILFTSVLRISDVISLGLIGGFLAGGIVTSVVADRLEARSRRAQHGSQLFAGADAELGMDAAQVPLDCARAEEELRADFGVGQSF